MQAITPTLRPTQQGPEISNLHTLLDKLGAGDLITASERAEQRFGDGTLEAVSRMQAQFGIATNPPGVVDQKTADLIHQRLLDAGVFRVVQGGVSDTAGARVQGQVLRAVDKDNVAGVALGTDSSKASGSYRIFYDPLLYLRPGPGVIQPKEIIDLIVQATDERGSVITESQPIRNPQREERIDLRIESRPAAENDRFIVRGQVFDAGGPVNGIHVDVFDRDLFFRRDDGNRGQLLNAETQITRNLPPKNEDGCFEFAYTTNDFVAGDIPRDGATIPDLIFALSRDGRTFENLQIFRLPDGQQLAEELLVSDDDLKMGIQARKIEAVRIVIDGGKPRRELSEYELLLRAITRLLPESIPADGDDIQREANLSAAAQRFDEKEHRDISFVARETGFDNHIIEALVAAFSIARDPFQNQLRPFIFYGLARTCAALDVLTLGRLSTDETRAALTEATAGTHPIIPPFDSEERLKETVRTLRELLEIHLPQHRPVTGGPSLADLMGASVPDTRDLATLWRTYSDHQGTTADFWQKLEAQPGFAESQKIAKVKYAFKLGALVQDNLSLINAVRAKHPAVVDTKELAFNLDTKEKWETLLTDVVLIPDDVPGKPEERKSNYAASLASAMQVAHPTVAVANMVAALPAEHLANQQTAVAKFLTDAVRKADFDLVAGHIDELVSSHGDVLLSEIAIEDRAIVIDQVKRLQRLFRLSTGPESMKVLLDAGFNSAREVASLPPEIAIEMLAPKLGEAAARIIVNRASNISAAAISQYVFLNDSINGEVPGGAL